ncbi:hypothetical protein BC938DRAFT_474636 [Jimgerdemannia flammicorona]|uniref:B box-type domain-containing protein n=1 Tax=Jimgerdemannia flammicorona TaxID=994334 RepID=A0A433QSD1_9FUNG|nr:hypothetical protein BC938DRAFT_474636 [Jimgerdemannia flammicorona]
MPIKKTGAMLTPVRFLNCRATGFIMTAQADVETKRTQLAEILSDRVSIMETDEPDEPIQDQETPQDMSPLQEGFCVECKDQESTLFCEQCLEDFCEVCHSMIHRTGTRKKHTSKRLKDVASAAAAPTTVNGNEAANASVPNSAPASARETPEPESAGASSEESEKPTMEVEQQARNINGTTIISSGGQSFGDWMSERAKYIPLRLSLEERKYLRLLEAAITVSEYTDKIDIISYTNKSKRIVNQIRDLCAILSGLVVACDYKLGQELFAERQFAENEAFFQTVFEIGRRHKIVNPEKMRSAYGKLMYMLQDSVIPEVQDMLSFSCVRPIKTVYSFLEEFDGLRILQDNAVLVATKEIIPDGKTRYQIQTEIKQKENAIEQLSRKYTNRMLSSESIRNCLYSIGDNHAYLRGNRDPCDKMLKYLTTYFHPNKIEPNYSLSITSGRAGHRLSHDHETQYAYVNQTLNLWREILHEMFMLWSLADRDLLETSNLYRLRDTGQGLNRVQACPSVGREMHRILHRAQQKAKYWVGSSVIHLGDRNVPNALMFIDKYNQVSRILNPTILCLEKLEDFAKNPGLQRYLDETFGGIDKCRKDILADFFRSAFDGSGADNFFDAGSCIDGRLTSAWNWCSQIEKKPYFPVFLLTGFVGFDGGSWN